MDTSFFELDRETGLLGGNPCLCSPHCDDRPQGVSIDTLVIHAISLPPGYFDTGPISDLFLGCLDADAHPYFKEVATLKVSAHFVIGRNGDVTQFVPVTGEPGTLANPGLMGETGSMTSQSGLNLSDQMTRDLQIRSMTCS